MIPRRIALSLAALALALAQAACSGITRVPETPQLGLATSAAPTQPPATIQAAVTQAVADTSAPAPTDEPEPRAVPPTPTVGLPEGSILLPTQPRPAATPPPPAPLPVFPPGALEATLAAQPPAVPDVLLYNAVYQRYEHGAMLYVAELRAVWVLIEAPGERGGPYHRFDDLFLDGDAEAIDDLPVPPGLLQPHRGFGRIWREQPGLRSQIGWAADYERPFAMRAARVLSGGFDPAGNFIPGAAVWMMTILDQDLLVLNEASNTWAMGSLN